MENIRIWSNKTKRTEAVWLGYLLTLCGYQVWKGKLAEESFPLMCQKGSGGVPYVEILLWDMLGAKELDFCNRLAAVKREGIVWISGDGQYWFGAFQWGASAQLKMSDASTLMELMEGLYILMGEKPEERKGVLRLVSAYAAQNNALAGSMYTIHELFCSRRINYNEYQNKQVLREAINQVESWYQEYVVLVYKNLSYGEEFALTYIQNMIDEAYIKAHVPGGFDVRVILRNANYLLKCNPNSTAVLFLKLQILRNCVNYQENPDSLLEKIVSGTEKEYKGRAYCEMGDIVRENSDKVFKFSALEYYEQADDNNPEGYCGLYKLGYQYSEQGSDDPAELSKAQEKYGHVIADLSFIPFQNRTPQEFEYLYKARYGKIKSGIERDKVLGNMTDERKQYYRNELDHMIEEIKDYEKLTFWEEFYINKVMRQKALAFMGEKMQGIEMWASRLMEEVQEE